MRSGVSRRRSTLCRSVSLSISASTIDEAANSARLRFPAHNNSTVARISCSDTCVGFSSGKALRDQGQPRPKCRQGRDVMKRERVPAQDRGCKKMGGFFGRRRCPYGFFQRNLFVGRSSDFVHPSGAFIPNQLCFLQNGLREQAGKPFHFNCRSKPDYWTGSF